MGGGGVVCSWIVLLDCGEFPPTPSYSVVNHAAVQIEGQWVAVEPLTHLGNNWVMNKPHSASEPRTITVRITSHGGDVYGAYEVAFTCDEECVAAPGMDAPAKKSATATCSNDGDTCSV